MGGELGLIWASKFQTGVHQRFGRVGILLSELSDNPVNKSSLGKRNGPGRPVTVDSDPDTELNITQVRDVPDGLHLRFENGVLLRWFGDGEEIIDVNSRDNDAGLSSPVVDARLAC